METFLRGDKIQKGSIGYDALSDDAKVLIGTNGDSLFEKGDANNSAVLKGGNNQVISEGGVALGKDNLVGLKGWYINSFNYVESKGIIHISNQNTELGEYIEDDNFNNPYEVGDIISIQIGSIFTNIGCIDYIKGNYMTFDSLKYFSLPQSDPEKRYYLWVLSKPNAGVIDLGQNGVSYGLNNQSLSECAYTEGKNNKAFGKYAHVEGKENEAHYCAHAEGSNNVASGNTSHVEGTDNVAANSNSHAEGRYTKSRGYASHAEGYGLSKEDCTESIGEGSHAEGRSTKAEGLVSHAEGFYTLATGEGSHAEGNYTHAKGLYSHAEGKGESTTNRNLAEGNYSHVEGEKTKTLGTAAHAEGGSSIAKGNFSHSEGRFTRAHALCSHAEGFSIEGSEDAYGAFGPISHVEGYANKTTSDANSAHAEGRLNTVSGMGAHVEGISNKASGEASHAEGQYTQALGKYSHAEGGGEQSSGSIIYTIASGDYSHAEGHITRATGYGAHAEGGYYTRASGKYSHAEGRGTEASGSYSHAEGSDTKASGDYSHAEGRGTEASNQYEHAQGKYNKSTKSTYESVGTRFSIGIGTSNENRKNAVEVKANGDVYIIGVGGYDGTNPDTSYDLATYLPNMVNITYDELVALRDTSKLIPGQQYRITDYVTTTTQSNTQSAGHQFDVIVTADDMNVLNENARAIQHEGDTYFSNSDLNAWELKYCIDNDTDRFAWADATNGKGVIYYMKDEFNNECPYDFKNIQFARWELSNPVGYRNDFDFEDESDNWIQESTPFDSLKTGFYGLNGSENVFYYTYNDNYDCYKYRVEYTISSQPTYCYTFGNGTDYSISGSNYGNVIKEYKNGKKIQLNNIVFLSNSCYSNSFGNNCYDNSFGNNCSSNIFGNNCYYNIFGNSCYYNSFGNSCYFNIFGNSCYYNSFGNYCYDNIFGNNYYDNIFGNNCYDNIFGNNCSSNIFGDSCTSNSFGIGCNSNSLGNRFYSNSFGDYCTSNSFGIGCYSNIFGDSCTSNSFCIGCTSNSFGNRCSSNIFGDSCKYNSFGNSCTSNSFGNSCNSNSFGNSCNSNSLGNNCRYNSFGESKDNLKSYYRYIIFDNGNSYINLNCTSTTSSSKCFQNVRIGLGVNNTTTKKTISDSNVGQTYQTLYKPTDSKDLTV